MSNNNINEISDSTQPQVIEHFIGQSKVKNLVQTALEACWMDGSRFPDTLALGSPGLGKTQIAHLIAAEVASECKEVLASSFCNISELHSFLIEAKDKDILFFDELHTLRKDLMVVFYRAMENRKIFIKSNNRKTPFTIDLPNFSLIGATTDYHLLPKPLLDRYKMILTFEFYSEHELEQIVRHRCQKLRWECQEEVFSRASFISRGTPRICLRILENTRRVARADGSDIITVQHLERSCSLHGLDSSIGLGPEEQKYLQVLSDHNGQVRLNTIAMCLGTLSRNVSQTIEPFLFRTGLITKDDKGRMLTPKGYEYIMNNQIE